MSWCRIRLLYVYTPFLAFRGFPAGVIVFLIKLAAYCPLSSQSRAIADKPNPHEVADLQMTKIHSMETSSLPGSPGYTFVGILRLSRRFLFRRLYANQVLRLVSVDEELIRCSKYSP